MTASTASTSLTAADRGLIAGARALADLPPDACRTYTGTEDPEQARAEVLGDAQAKIDGLLAIIDRLSGA